MTIQQTDMKFYRAEVEDDTASNGGYMSSIESITNTYQNLFPSVSVDERTNGITRYRKLFAKLEHLTVDIGLNPRMFVDEYTPGADAVYLFSGTQTDVQSDINAPNLFGCGQVTVDLAAGATTILVQVEEGTVPIFRGGDTIRISDKSIITQSGNEEYHVISGNPTTNGDVVTIVISTPLTFGYLAVDTRVSSVIQALEIKSYVDGYTIASVGTGSYDFSSTPVATSNVGTTEDAITITFDSATTYTVAGAKLGSLGSGNISSNFNPINPDFSEIYFSVLSSGWAGAWQSGDTFSFNTRPSSYPLWAQQEVPAGSPSYSGNNVKIGWVIES